MIVSIPNRPAGVLYPGYRWRLFSRSETNEGYTLIRCAKWLIGKQRRFVNRIFENITFGISSTWAAWRAGRPDVMIIESWPLFATQFTASLASWWNVPYLYYVEDVYPEAAEQAGILTPKGILARLCRAWDRRLCLRSASVIVISETMRDLVAANRQLPRDHFTVIPNWLDESKFPARQSDGAWRHAKKIDDGAFVALFAGNMGRVSGVEVLVEVAQLLKGAENLILLCIGEGVQKQGMLEKTSSLRLTNIRFLPFEPGERVPEFQAACDVALLTMRPNTADTSVPSKLISYLAASRPVICVANAKSAVARTVLDAAAGIVVCPGDAKAIADAILKIRREPETARQMGTNARRYFEEHYTLERAHKQFSVLIQQIKPSAAHP